MARVETRTIIGYFRNRADAEKSVQDLRDNGFTAEQLGMAVHAGEPAEISESHPSFWGRIFGGKKTEEYKGSEFQGSLEYAGVPPERARYFEYQLNQADTGALVTVTAPGREATAEQIMERDGGDLGANASEYMTKVAAATSGGTASVIGQGSRETAETSGERARPEAGRRTIQLLGEMLRIHKERIPLGEVRMRKEVVTETQNVQVPVSREEVVLERHPAGETAVPKGEIGKGDTEIRIPVSEERVTVEKKPTVREEVEVAKDTVENTRNVSEDVRHEELRVDKDEKVDVKGESAPPPKVRKRGA